MRDRLPITFTLVFFLLLVGCDVLLLKGFVLVSAGTVVAWRGDVARIDAVRKKRVARSRALAAAGGGVVGLGCWGWVAIVEVSGEGGA
jgi:hypothetical protein